MVRITVCNVYVVASMFVCKKLTGNVVVLARRLHAHINQVTVVVHYPRHGNSEIGGLSIAYVYSTDGFVSTL